MSASLFLDERAAVIGDLSLQGRSLCRSLAEATDTWLAALLEDACGGDTAGLALVATGGYGRQQLAPESDIDVWLIHDGRADVSQISERLWYPIWDAGLKLGHAVRTPKQALEAVSQDLDAATAAISARHIAGDGALGRETAEAIADRWRKKGARWLDTLHLRITARHRLAGELAFLLEPDLKESRGGLRDVHALRWAEAARPVMLPGDAEALEVAEDTLLDIRVALHRVTRRPGDDLALERQDDVAAVLDAGDADALMARVAGAGRTVAWISDEVWRRETNPSRGHLARVLRRDRELAPAVVLHEGEVRLDAPDPTDRTLVLRIALAAARTGAPIDRASVDWLGSGAPVLDDSWPDDARTMLVDLLATGPAAIPVLETLDQRRLVERLLPEWSAVRGRVQRNALHRYTVDRHLCETAAVASSLMSNVSRPDLLLVAAWLHDLGKGYPGDHTEAGIRLIRDIGRRMGFPAADLETLCLLVAHHLLLPDVATRRDLSDPDVIADVAHKIGTVERLDLLAALSEADGIATGPSAWGAWKAELVHELVRRVRHVLEGGAPGELVGVEFPSAGVRQLMAEQQTFVGFDGPQLIVVAPDRAGLFSRVAGTLALKGLTVLAAEAGGSDGMAVSQFRVDSGGVEVSWGDVAADVRRAIAGELAIEARLAERGKVARRRAEREPEVRIDNDASSSSTVVEVHAADRIGVLYRITRAFADLDLDIGSAKVATLGDEVVDSFYVRTAAGGKVEGREHVRELERAILHQLSL
jgi:[protein-PII] uridylyltransferase